MLEFDRGDGRVKGELNDAATESSGGASTRFGDRVDRFVGLTAEAALHATIQDPIDAFQQLLDRAVVKPLTGYELPRLELIPDLPQAEFGSADWLAERIGVGIGRTADFLLVGAGLKALGVTPAAGAFAASQFESSTAAAFANAMTQTGITGTVFGLTIIPAEANSENFWLERSINGAAWGVGSAVGGAVAQYASGWGAEAGNASAATSIKAFAGKELAAMIRSSTGDLAKTGVFSLLGTEALSPQPISGRVIEGITRALITDAVQ